ncbi:TolC family protein [Candidatus Uabimicrobium sp. HlEnr_7]|uniref:TolC family protein n=1 Tax=Candidatus Uabimicrobium helgolandensis TaxID=3095367 RepID=UPI003556B2AE
MNNYNKVFLLLLSVLTGCWSYTPQTNISKPPHIESIFKKKTLAQESTEQENVKKLKTRWQESLRKDDVQKINLYDFDSPTAKKYRSFADAPNNKLSQDLSLELLIQLAYERNSSIKDVKKRLNSVKQRYSQTFFLQNLLSQYSSFTRTINTKVAMQSQRPKTEMNTPQPGRLTIMGEIINTEVQIAELDYIITLRNLINKITKDYADLIYARESLHIQKEHNGIVSALENTVRDKFRAGLAGYGDVLKAQILKANIEEDMKTYEERLKTIKIRILTTLELPTDSKLGIPAEKEKNKLEIKLSNLYEKALKHRQEIKQIELKSKKMEQIISLAKDKLYPDFTIGLSYFENRNKERVGSGKQDIPFPDRSQKMPRFDFGQRDSYIEEMMIKNAAIKEKLQNTKQKTITQIRDLYFQVDTSWRQIILHQKKLIPLAKEALKVTRVSYQVGKKVDFLDVLDAERTLLNLSLMLAKNKKEYLWNVADLQKTIGIFEFSS